MRKIRGIKLGKRLCRVTRWFFFRKPTTRPGYHRLSPPSSPPCKYKPIAKLLTWGRQLSTGAKSLCCGKPGSGYMQLGQNPVEQTKPVTVPKGHLAVYVGQKDGDFHRVLVPVIYFNHPLFGQLLKEAEQEYGFTHPGGITIPCPISDFESVKTRIAAGSGHRRLIWKRNS
ncbi:auxin-responsive protein SAUR36-like [Rosa rugosa]|uniref:Putative small auxin-up RNA n=1 Tax=Rosa chinensis TaxID=74649 RepID=A0A2P6SFT8_ROSCH|nr:auxin-responsive protein SAUR36 [Rosa chinensis]XP_061999964.1 auxin-responsive protein SAUR36-like [Rosa rugosa]PRQ57540.1 putative small auxin-up RNA [Rosa chinensis]